MKEECKNMYSIIQTSLLMPTAALDACGDACPVGPVPCMGTMSFHTHQGHAGPGRGVVSKSKGTTRNGSWSTKENTTKYGQRTDI